MIYGLIIAAGNQTRFENKTPKALMKIDDIPLLELNINAMNETCDKVYVVVSATNQEWFSAYNKIVIESGFGCGDAVMKALSQLDLSQDDTVFVQWGDCKHTPSVYKTLAESYSGKWIIPCVEEEKPYVQILPNSTNGVKVLFSKYGEATTIGFHDISLFYGNAKKMYESLQSFASSTYSVLHSHYIHKHNNELLFLDVFNETDLPAEIMLMQDYDLYDFNTIEEFNKLFNS